LCTTQVFAVYGQGATSTPIQIVLPTNTPIFQEATSGETNQGIILATSTEAVVITGNVFLEALDIANVRRLPATDEDQLGVIRAGETYVVTARHFAWYQLQYDPSPTGFGWVYGELVQITGDAASVPEIDPFSLSGEFFSELAGDGPTPTGGIVATVTAIGGSGLETVQEIMPTFTYPPGVARPLPTDPNTVAADATPAPTIIQTSSGDVPPIAPIILLGALGLLGLVVSSLRR
jgi:hypothetical protein